MNRKLVMVAAVLMIAVMSGWGGGGAMTLDEANDGIDSVSQTAQEQIDAIDAKIAANTASLDAAVAFVASLEAATEPLSPSMAKALSDAKVLIASYPKIREDLARKKTAIVEWEADSKANIEQAYTDGQRGLAVAESWLNLASIALGTTGAGGLIAGISAFVRSRRTAEGTAKVIAAGRAADPSFNAVFENDKAPATVAMKAVLAGQPKSVTKAVDRANESVPQTPLAPAA